VPTASEPLRTDGAPSGSRRAGAASQTSVTPPSWGRTGSYSWLSCGPIPRPEGVSTISRKASPRRHDVSTGPRLAAVDLAPVNQSARLSGERRSAHGLRRSLWARSGSGRCGRRPKPSPRLDHRRSLQRQLLKDCCPGPGQYRCRCGVALHIGRCPILGNARRSKPDGLWHGVPQSELRGSCSSGYSWECRAGDAI
jgi:hypothetical protein